MSSTLPKGQLILSYAQFYGIQQPDNPLTLLEGFDLATMLGEFAALNYRLKPRTTMYYDTSLETQLKELFYFCGNNNKIYNEHRPLFEQYIINERQYPLVFTRQTCLYAMEELVHSSLQRVKGFTMRHSWPRLLQYLLSVNTMILNKMEKDEEEVVESLDENSNASADQNSMRENITPLEEINSKMISLNELSLDINPFYTPYRGYHLLEFFANHAEFGRCFSDYFNGTYAIPFDRFVYEQLSMCYANNVAGINDITNEVTGEKMETSFYYTVKEEDRSLFNALSNIYPNENIERLISIRKYPFVKTSDRNYVLTDSNLLLDKSYSQFINDFWFDCVKTLVGEGEKAKYPIKYYRSEIGKFLEHYCRNVIDHSFQNAKHYIVKTFKDLLVTRVNRKEELTDVYIRYTDKIFIAEVKSTGLYDEEKYSGDIDKMYKGNRGYFFKSFGIDQLVTTIKELKNDALQVDPGFPQSKRIHIYPAIIVNERALQTPLMAPIFKNRFDELLSEKQFGNMHIYPLTIIHVSDLENMEDYLHKEPNQFWKILRYHIREPDFMPPFFNTLYRLEVRPDFRKLKVLFGQLVEKYQGTRP